MKDNSENSELTGFIEQLIEKDKIINPNPFLYTRIMGKIQNYEQSEQEFIPVNPVKFAFICALLFLALNIYLIATYSNTPSVNKTQQTFEQFFKESHFDMINYGSIANNLINE